MKKCSVLLAALLLAVLALAVPAEAGGWKHVALYDSLSVSGLTADADTVTLARTRPGRMMMLFQEVGITNSATAPTFNVQGKLEELDGQDRWVQASYTHGTTGVTAAIDLDGSNLVWITVGPGQALYTPGTSRNLYDRVRVIITKNDCTAGYLMLWVWYWEE